jgi:hypothetical protein
VRRPIRLHCAGRLISLRRAIDLIAPVFVQVYGRFEGGWPRAILGAEDHLARVRDEPLLGGAAAGPIDQTEIKIRPITGHPPGTGELCVRNKMVVREAADPDGSSCAGTRTAISISAAASMA